MAKAEEKGVKVHLPTDALTASKFAEDAEVIFRVRYRLI